MLILILGVALWWGAHLFKRIAPARRATMGDKGKGLVAACLLISVLLMILGYGASGGAVWWGRSPALVGINNLLVLVAFYLFAAAGMRTRITARMRHPQLTGFALWSGAHLLVNGDAASLVLFGGLFLWALAEMAAINRAEPVWTPARGPFPVGKEVGAVLGAILVMGVVGLIHRWLGYNPFGG